LGRVLLRESEGLNFGNFAKGLVLGHCF